MLGDQGFRNILVTREIDRPGWLIAGTITAATGGRTWRFVYRSPMLRDTDAMYSQAAEFIGDAPMIGEPQTVNDASMMFGRGELAVYGGAR